LLIAAAGIDCAIPAGVDSRRLHYCLKPLRGPCAFGAGKGWSRACLRRRGTAPPLCSGGLAALPTLAHRGRRNRLRDSNGQARHWL